jgi:hypothetical protein
VDSNNKIREVINEIKSFYEKIDCYSVRCFLFFLFSSCGSG